MSEERLNRYLIYLSNEVCKHIKYVYIFQFFRQLENSVLARDEGRHPILANPLAEGQTTAGPGQRRRLHEGGGLRIEEGRGRGRQQPVQLQRPAAPITSGDSQTRVRLRPAQ